MRVGVATPLSQRNCMRDISRIAAACHNLRPFAGRVPPASFESSGDSMDFLISSAYAQATPAAAPNPLMSFLPLIILFGIFYFMLIRPQMKRAKEQKAMITALARGDEVVTTGGLLGRIDEMADQFVTLEIADGVRVKVSKQHITAVLPKGTLKAS